MIGNLVHSSPNIKKEVLQAGALQPVIRLLRYNYICFEQLLSNLRMIGQNSSKNLGI